MHAAEAATATTLPATSGSQQLWQDPGASLTLNTRTASSHHSQRKKTSATSLTPEKDLNLKHSLGKK